MLSRLFIIKYEILPGALGTPAFVPDVAPVPPDYRKKNVQKIYPINNLESSPVIPCTPPLGTWKTTPPV